jgi:hypothetical protein
MVEKKKWNGWYMEDNAGLEDFLDDDPEDINILPIDPDNEPDPILNPDEIEKKFEDELVDYLRKKEEQEYLQKLESKKCLLESIQHLRLLSESNAHELADGLHEFITRLGYGFELFALLYPYKTEMLEYLMKVKFKALPLCFNISLPSYIVIRVCKNNPEHVQQVWKYLIQARLRIGF